jgi:hypothetical protein
MTPVVLLTLETTTNCGINDTAIGAGLVGRVELVIHKSFGISVFQPSPAA